MAAEKTNLDKMKASEAGKKRWHRGLMGAVRADPWYCCFAFLCPLCASYSLRKRALQDDMSRYKCCDGKIVCSACSYGGNRGCAECCLCMEVCLCFHMSVGATRDILQKELNIRNNCCDNCITGCIQCLAYIFCLLNCIATGNANDDEGCEALCCFPKLLLCLVCVCMQTQHKIEMDNRDSNPKSTPEMAPPPVQEMSLTD